MKTKRRLLSWLLCAALLVCLLPTSALAADNTTHDISTGTLTISQNGNYTVTGTTTTNRIVVGEGVTATVTLNGVNITGEESGSTTLSLIDLSKGATLTLILADSTSNTLVSGAGTTYDGTPGIHVPTGATLIIQGGGSLSVTGRDSKTGFGGVGIGGRVAGFINTGYGPGEDCGTVIILSGVITVKGGSGIGNEVATDIGGGGGMPGGGNGQGIRPVSGKENTYEIWGNLTLPQGVTIPEDAILTGSGSLTSKLTQSAPNAPTLNDRTSTSVTLNAPAGAVSGKTVEYGYVQGTGGGTPTNWTSSPIFNVLTPDTAYTFYARYQGNRFYKASEASSGTTIYTAYAVPGGNEGYTINYAAETVAASSNYEVKLSDGDTWTTSGTALTITPGGTFQVRHAEMSGGAPASDAATVNVKARPDAPTCQGENETVDGKITGLDSGNAYQISSDNGSTWTDATLTGSEIINLAPGTYYVRVKATDSSFASKSATVEIATGAARTYTLNVTAPSFDAVTYGYAQPEAKPITITSSGNSAAAISSVTVDSQNFVIGGSGSTVTAGGEITSWMIQPAADLESGTYKATITVTYNDGATATDTVSFTVNPAAQEAPAAAPELESSTTSSITLKAVPDNENGAKAEYSRDGGSTWQASPAFEGLSSGTSYTFAVRYAATGSYAVSPASPAASFSTPNSGGSGGVSTYTVSTPSAVEGGTVTVRPKNASKGATVTVTVTPNDGYELDALTVTDSRGNELPLTDKGDGKYTFTMPRSRVTVEAVFTEIAPEPLPFTDVPEGYWAETAIRYVYENGMMTGTSGATFSPETTITRGQIVTILWRLESSPVVDYLMDFSDVDPAAYYGEAIRWAAGEGVAVGYGNGRFGPGDTITREQLAVMLYRYAQYKGYDATQGGMAIREYSDYDQISGYALEAMDWAVNAGLISGTSGSTLSPQGSATRAQAAVILMRFCENIV